MFKIEYKIGLVFFIAFAAIFSTQLLIRAYITLPDYYRMEAILDQKDKNRIEGALEGLYKQYQVISFDNAVWDDMYEYVLDRNQEFIERNYNVNNVFSSNGLNGISIYDNTGQLLWQKAVDLSSFQGLQLTWQPGGTDDPLRAMIITSDEIEKNGGRPVSKSGLISTHSGPVIVAITSIFLSDGEGQSPGSLVLWRLWDSEIETLLNSRTSLPVTWKSVASFNEQEWFRSTNINPHIRDEDNRLSWFIEGLDEQPILYVQINYSSHYFKTGFMSTPFLLSIAVAFMALLILNGFLRSFLIKPVKQIQTHMYRVKHEGDYTKKLSLARDDELGQLSVEYDQLLDHITLQEKALKQANEQLKKQAETDSLTNIANRRMLDEFLVRHWDRAIIHKYSIALCLCDIDYFKDFNDHYGHQRGDQVLTTVANCLDQNVHLATDLVARYGGEEFAVVLTKTSAEDALRVGEALRSAVYDLFLPHKFSQCAEFVTLSIGIAAIIPCEGMSADQLVEAADTALYHAKRNGRNCCELYDDLIETKDLPT